MRKLLWIALLGLVCLIVTSPAASAEELKQVTIPNFGTFSIPTDFIFTETTNKGSKVYSLAANDKGIWRSNIIITVVMSNVSLEAFESNPAAIENAMNSSAGAGAIILEKGSLKSAIVGNKKVMTGTLRALASGMAVNMNIYLFENTKGVVMTLFTSPDGDAAFWHPHNTKIIAGLQ